MIVVTGAAGLIGSGIVRRLNDLGFSDNLILVDTVDHPEKSRNLQNKKYLQLIPISEFHAFLKGKESEIQAIVHLGACSNTLEKNALFLQENNTLFTQRLAEYCVKNGIRFIYASSAATYGDGTLGFSDDHDLLQQLKPLNLYGESKHAFDLWALKEGILDQIVGLKYFNVFGPNEAHKGAMASMIFKMVPVIQKEGVIRLFKSNDPDRFEDGGQCRDFIYVKDAVDFTCAFLDNDLGGIFNVGMGEPTTWNALSSAVFKALGIPERIEYIEMPKELSSQYQNYTCAKIKKKIVNCRPIEEATQDYVQNYLMTGQAW